ncbi:MAG: hypothetical protein LC785_16390 [Acidobacteria bacterium]|nr:hypothetical protein [Acidobacteriota bacterium]MCA1643483.1 hypothetical protein [Acidobacteriota bacterium]
MLERATFHPRPAARSLIMRGHSCPALYALLLALAFALPSLAQKSASPPRLKLPSPDKIISDYVKASGGKKRLASVTDVTYEWSARADAQAEGVATTRAKSPSAISGALSVAGSGSSWGTTPRAAWVRGRDGVVSTLTGDDAKLARLRATLEASKLFDYKRQNLSALTVGVDAVGGEQAYVVEFRSRDGARARYLFGATTKLLLATSDAQGRTLARYSDYRPVGGVIEPHRIELETGDAGMVTLTLKSARYNTGFGSEVFDAPKAEDLDARALIKAVMEKEPATNMKFEDFTYTVKETERELNERGETTKETSKAWDIFLTPGGQGIGKLVEENGQPLPPAEAAKQEKRVADFLAAHENDKPAPAKKGGGGFRINLGDYGFGLDDLLRACDFVSPRRETFNGRESVVFDYRARADFQPKSKNDEILKKIVGLIWIDEKEKVVSRIEARLTDDIKLGGGLFKINGAGFVFERARLPDGYWVPNFYHWNANGKGFFFMKKSVYEVTEWKNFKRFKAESGEVKINTPQP